MHTLSRACLKASSYQTVPVFDTCAKFCSKHAFAQLLFGRTSARATRFGEKLSNRKGLRMQNSISRRGDVRHGPGPSGAAGGPLRLSQCGGAKVLFFTAYY